MKTARVDLLCFDPATNRKLIMISFYETKTDKRRSRPLADNRDSPPTTRLNTLNPNSPPLPRPSDDNDDRIIIL
jgi:hypothetical protein